MAQNFCENYMIIRVYRALD